VWGSVRLSARPSVRGIVRPLKDLSALAHCNIDVQKSEGSPYSITERMVPELIPVLGSQPACDMNHKPDGRLPLLYARPAVTPATLKRAATNFAACCLVNRGTIGVNSLPKTATRQRRNCDLNPGLSVPEFSTLTTQLPSHPTGVTKMKRAKTELRLNYCWFVSTEA